MLPWVKESAATSGPARFTESRCKCVLAKTQIQAQHCCLQVEATMYSNSTIVMKQRTFNVCNDVKYAHRLIPIVTAPSHSIDGKPRVLWSRFHDTVPVDDSSEAGRAGSISVWPEQGQLADRAASSSSADEEGSDATATISHRGLDRQRSSLLPQRSGEQCLSGLC